MCKKIMIVIDSKGWAIDHLAQVKIKYNPHYEFKTIYVHPRDAISTVTQENFKKELLEFNPDLVHFEYFNSAKPLLDNVPELKNYRIILTHHNQKDKALGLMDWYRNGVNRIVTHTNKCAYLLIERYLQPRDRVNVINHGIDLDYFKYSSELNKSGMIGYCGRVVPWKGLKEIARCAKKLNKKVLFVGKMDKADYWQEILREGLDAFIDFTYFDCADEDRLDAYHSMEIFVNNSEDGYEEGPLPLLEAMACGVPVVTTPSGIAHEIAIDGNNSLVTRFKDEESLFNNIKTLLEDDVLKKKFKENGWNTVKNMSDKKMARDYDVIYQKTYAGNRKEIVSVIIPTFNRLDKVKEVLLSLNEQTYKNFEVIVCDDNSDVDDIKSGIDSISKDLSFPVKYLNTLNSGYGLSQARNIGAVEAIGDILIFLDSRIKPVNDTIDKFVKLFKDNYNKIWYFGNKGADKSSFVENFSAVRRSDFITFGMFCERINKYGGISEETRIRWSEQDGLMKYCSDINATELMSTKKSNDRRSDIVDMKLMIYKMYNSLSNGYDKGLKYKQK